MQQERALVTGDANLKRIAFGVRPECVFSTALATFRQYISRLPQAVYSNHSCDVLQRNQYPTYVKPFIFTGRPDRTKHFILSPERVGVSFLESDDAVKNEVFTIYSGGLTAVRWGFASAEKKLLTLILAYLKIAKSTSLFVCLTGACYEG